MFRAESALLMRYADVLSLLLVCVRMSALSLGDIVYCEPLCLDVVTVCVLFMFTLPLQHSFSRLLSS